MMSEVFLHYLITFGWALTGSISMGVGIIVALKDAAPDGFQFLKSPADEPRPGLVGLHVPPEAIFQVKKRAMSNVGKGTITLRLAKSANRATRAVELSGRKTADYNELRRS